MYTGPHIIKDGLVFGYDTGYGIADNSTATRFYPGKPTSNALETEANWIYIGANITNPADYPVALPAEVDFQKGASQGGISWSDACRNYVDSYSAGTKITVSGWHMFYSTDTSLTMNSRDRLGWHYNKDGVSTYGGTIYTATQWNKWYYFSSTFSSTGVTTNLRVEDGGADYYRSSEDAAKTTQYYCNLQIEVGTDIVSPHVLGTRSSTASLIDLKETTDIDVSNVSFDSTGQPTFDGTNDYISIDVDSWIRSVNSVTVEGVVIIPSGASLSGGPWAILTDHSTSSAKDGFWWHMSLGGGYTYFRVEDAVSGEQGITFSGATPFASGNTYHIVTIVGLNSVKIYVNGVLSKSYTPTFNWANISASHTASLFIGRTFPGYWLNSTNPVVKVYDTALTEAEIKQNYNAYKNRFDI